MDRIERLPGLNSGLSPITVHPVTRNNWTTAHHTTTLSIPNRKINGQNQSWLSCIRWSSCHQFGAIIWKPNRRNTRRIRAIRWASLRRFKSLHRISYLCSSSTWHHSVAFVSIQRVEFCSRLTRFYCFNWNTNHLCWWQLHKNQNFLKEGLTCLQVPTMSTKW